MFYSFSYFQKVIILFFSYSLIIAISIYLFKLSIYYKDTLSILTINLLQGWNLVLIGFLFFQAFKHYRLSEKFYQIKKFETPLFFKLLGVNFFRLFLINSFFRHLNSRVYLRNRPKEYIPIYIEETKQSETSHLFSMICTFSIQIIYFKNELWEHVIWLSIFSILLNLYPILLQRMNRIKIREKYPDYIN